MNCYIALLRGINVSGQKKILMADLRGLLEKAGLKEVQTYIQSGNVVFTCASAKASGDTRAEEEQNFEKIIADAIEIKYGWKVPILVKKASELAEIIQNCPFSEEKKAKSYFILLQNTPAKDSITSIANLSHPDEEFHIEANCVYIHYSLGAGKAKMGTNFFENKLKVAATARNYRTMMKLLGMVSD